MLSLILWVIGSGKKHCRCAASPAFLVWSLLRITALELSHLIFARYIDDFLRKKKVVLIGLLLYRPTERLQS